MRYLIIAITMTVAIFYGHLAKNAIDAGAYFWIPIMLILPFILGYFVGDEADKADYHRIIERVRSVLRWR